MEHGQAATFAECNRNSLFHGQQLFGKGKRHSRGQPMCIILYVKVGLQELNAKCTKGTPKQ